MRFSLSCILIIGFLGFIESASAICYNPDGSQMTDPAQQPCFQGTDASQCCATNKTVADTCLANGLCKFDGLPSPGVWRGGCTDKTWGSKYCLPNVCTSSSYGGSTGSIRLFNCSDGSWCCYDDVNCCSQGRGVFIPATLGDTINSSAPTSSQTSSSSSQTSSSGTKSSSSISITQSSTLNTSSTSSNRTRSSAALTSTVGTQTLTLITPSNTQTSSPSSSTSSPIAGPSSSGSTSDASKVGIGVGVAGGSLGIAALIAATLIYRHRRGPEPYEINTEDLGVSRSNTVITNGTGEKLKHEDLMIYSPSELPATPMELDSYRSPVELRA